MKDIVYINSLFDEYNSLLTEKQKEYFKDHYFDDLSISEISENNMVSRAASHKAIKDVLNKLEFYEENLRIVEKKNKIIEVLKDSQYLEKIKEIL